MADFERLVAKVSVEKSDFDRGIRQVDRQIEDVEGTHEALVLFDSAGGDKIEAEADILTRDRTINVDYDFEPVSGQGVLFDPEEHQQRVDFELFVSNLIETEAALAVVGRDRDVAIEPELDNASVAKTEAELKVLTRERNIKLDFDRKWGLFGKALPNLVRTILPDGQSVFHGEGMWGKFIPSASQMTDMKKFRKLVDQLGGSVSGVGEVATTAGMSLASLGKFVLPLIAAAILALLPAISSLISLVIALSAYVIGLVAAFSPLVGLLLTLPGLIMGLVVVMGVLALAFKDVFPAIQEELQIANRSAKEQAELERQAAQAETSLAQARLTKAQADRRAAEAHRDAAEAIEDAQFAARQAQLSEEAAVLGLERAYQRLQDVQSDIAGKTEEITKVTDDFTGKQFEVTRITYDAVSAREDERDALLAVKSAELNLEMARDRREDTERSLRDLESRGIENSDLLVGALLAQKSATEALAAAEAAYTEAKAKAAGENLALAEEQQSVVDFVTLIGDLYTKHIKPLIEDLQDAILPPLTEALKNMIPLLEQLGPILIPIAEGFGAMIEGFTRTFIGPDYSDITAEQRRFLEINGVDVDDPNGTLAKLKEFGEGLGEFLEAMGPVFGTFATALLDMTLAAKPVLDAFQTMLTDWANGLSDFASGETTSGTRTIDWWFEQTANVLTISVEIIGNLISAMAGLIVAIKPFTDWILGGLVEGTENLSDYANSAEGQEKIAAVFERMKAPLSEFVSLLGTTLKLFHETFASEEGMGLLTQWLQVTKDQVLPAVFGLFKALIDSGFLGELTNLVGNLAEAAQKGLGPSVMEGLEGLTEILKLINNVFDLLLRGEWTFEKPDWDKLLSGIANGFPGWWFPNLVLQKFTGQTITDWMKAAFEEVDWSSMWDDMVLASLTAFDSVANGFVDLINWIIEKWNGIELTIPGFGGLTAFGQEIIPGWEATTLKFKNPLGISEIQATSNLAGNYLSRIMERDRVTWQGEESTTLAGQNTPGGSSLISGLVDDLRDVTGELLGSKGYRNWVDNVGLEAPGPTNNVNVNVYGTTDPYALAGDLAWRIR